jgi:hypothetical protein
VAHALTQPLHAEFLCLKDFPLQCKDEIFLEKRKILGASKKGNVFLRKIEEGKALRIHRASLGYRPSGLSAADMRARLLLLLPKIEERIKLGEAAGTEDDGSHEICLDYASRIKTMLAANPPNVVAVPVSVPVANVASSNHTTPSPGDTPPRAVRVITVVSKAKQAQAQAQH